MNYQIYATENQNPLTDTYHSIQEWLKLPSEATVYAQIIIQQTLSETSVCLPSPACIQISSDIQECKLPLLVPSGNANDL